MSLCCQLNPAEVRRLIIFSLEHCRGSKKVAGRENGDNIENWCRLSSRCRFVTIFTIQEMSQRVGAVPLLQNLVLWVV
jgi:hypothetical protein